MSHTISRSFQADQPGSPVVRSFMDADGWARLDGKVAKLLESEANNLYARHRADLEGYQERKKPVSEPEVNAMAQRADWLRSNGIDDIFRPEYEFRTRDGFIVDGFTYHMFPEVDWIVSRTGNQPCDPGQPYGSKPASQRDLLLFRDIVHNVTPETEARILATLLYLYKTKYPDHKESTRMAVSEKIAEVFSSVSQTLRSRGRVAALPAVEEVNPSEVYDHVKHPFWFALYGESGARAINAAYIARTLIRANEERMANWKKIRDMPDPELVTVPFPETEEAINRGIDNHVMGLIQAIPRWQDKSGHKLQRELGFKGRGKGHVYFNELKGRLESQT